jgi:hypothetical protein
MLAIGKKRPASWAQVSESENHMADKILLEEETEHPAAKRMRLEFEAKYGDMAGVMREMNRWYNMRADWNAAFNRDREKPITEADVNEALQAVFDAVRATRTFGEIEELMRQDPVLIILIDPVSGDESRMQGVLDVAQRLGVLSGQQPGSFSLGSK